MILKDALNWVPGIEAVRDVKSKGGSRRRQFARATTQIISPLVEDDVRKNHGDMWFPLLYMDLFAKAVGGVFGAAAGSALLGPGIGTAFGAAGGISLATEVTHTIVEADKVIRRRFASRNKSK